MGVVLGVKTLKRYFVAINEILGNSYDPKISSWKFLKQEEFFKHIDEFEIKKKYFHTSLGSLERQFLNKSITKIEYKKTL